MRFLPPRSAWRVGLAVLCAAGIWAFFVNRVLLNLTESPWRNLAFVSLALVLGALALGSFGSSAPRRPRVWPWVLVLTLFALGEARRIWLRNTYRVEAPSPADLFSPVTTTSLRVTRFALKVRGLPVDRLRVVHLTDLHVSDALPKSYRTQVVHEVRAAEPDLIVLTGDYISRAERLPLLADWLSELPVARYGAFGVLGNHDYWTGQAEQVRAVLRHAGVRVLDAECASIPLAPESRLSLCGTDAPWGAALDVARVSAAQGESFATLILSHTPDNVYEFTALGVNAVFAGHTHGGQMRVPGLGALIIPSRYGRRFDQGHFLVERTHLFVSAGVGADSPPLRLWCPAELLVVELLPEGPPE